MRKGMSMWPTSRSRAPRLQLHRLVPMCMSCPSLRSPCPWLSSRVARVSAQRGVRAMGHVQWEAEASGCTSGWAGLEGYGLSSGPGASRQQA